MNSNLIIFIVPQPQNYNFGSRKPQNEDPSWPPYLFMFYKIIYNRNNISTVSRLLPGFIYVLIITCSSDHVMQRLVRCKGQLLQLFSVNVIYTNYLQIRYLYLNRNQHFCVVLHCILKLFNVFYCIIKIQQAIVLCFFNGLSQVLKKKIRKFPCSSHPVF